LIENQNIPDPKIIFFHQIFFLAIQHYSAFWSFLNSFAHINPIMLGVVLSFYLEARIRIRIKGEGRILNRISDKQDPDPDSHQYPDPQHWRMQFWYFVKFTQGL
jgi:hypothetical protein